MFDLDVSKLAVIGAVALVVIGPEKMPRVARTIGTMLDKAQRYVSDVKAEVNRAMEMATEEALLRDGDLVIQTAGTVADVSGSTDLVKVSIVGKGTVLDPTIM